MGLKNAHMALCVLITALLLLPVGRAHCEEGQPIKILLQWVPQAQFAGYIMAVEKGFFAEEGLPHVQLLWAQLGESPLQRLASGEVDFATAWLITGLQRRAEGLPIVNIAQFMQQSGTLVVARKDKNINTVAELSGKTILAWGGDFGFEFELFLQRNTITPGKVYPLSASLAPFLHGFVDAMQAMEYSEYLRVLERGMKPEEVVVFPLADHKVCLPGDGLYTRAAYLAKNKKVARAVRRAVVRGWQYAFAHEEETVAAVLKEVSSMNMGSNASYQLQMLNIVKKLMKNESGALGDLTRKSFTVARDIVLEAGLPLTHETYESFYINP